MSEIYTQSFSYEHFSGLWKMLEKVFEDILPGNSRCRV